MRRDALTHRREDARALLRTLHGGRMCTGWLRLRTPPPGGWPPWLDPGEPIPLTAAIARAEPGGAVVASFEAEGEALPAITLDGDQLVFHFDPHDVVERTVTERYLPRRVPLYSRLPGWALRLPGSLRLAGQHVVIPLQQLRHRDPPSPFPRFPREDALELLRWLAQVACGRGPSLPWPGGKPVIALSHDVDTGQGQRCIRPIARVEEALDLTSCWFVAGRRYPLDHSLLDELRAAGHEIGLHGARHDGKLAYLPPPRIARRLDDCADAIARHDMRGFRSPALLMTPQLARAVQERFEYDSSVPDTDIRAVAGPRRGCASVFPAWRDDLLQLPLTLPLDDRLLLLGHDPDELFDLWRAKLDWILEIGGLALITTHSEPHLGASRGVLDAYRRLLEYVAEQDATVLLPRQIAGWWRADSLDGAPRR